MSPGAVTAPGSSGFSGFSTASEVGGQLGGFGLGSACTMSRATFAMKRAVLSSVMASSFVCKSCCLSACLSKSASNLANRSSLLFWTQ